MLKDNTLTYISLFSCAGVGCFGFKQAGFECIATNELIERRLNVQKFNNKCKFDSGYICDDITSDETKKKVFDEIHRWEKLGNDRVDVLIATPPCQGMSVANHKKASNEIVRNSLVVESIKIIKDIHPRFFIFENVAAFIKTGCTAPDGTIKEIGTVIDEELSKNYVISSRILNFKNYGSNSSRTRTVVIGISRELSEYISPIELYPSYSEEKTLRNIIGNMPKLEWGEICSSDFYHSFRTYPNEMRCWIHDLKEGQGAFDNKDASKRPHKIVNGEIIFNKQKNGDKYTRQVWDKVAPCIHTRNDQLASQNTVHPVEDRVFSIRELMRLMTIPDDFKWNTFSLEQLNSFSEDTKRKILKQEEIKIRQSIGEAVPTIIFNQIANNIKFFMSKKHLTGSEINSLIKDEQLENTEKLLRFIKENKQNLDNASLSRIAELTNSFRENNSAYYTNKFLVNEIYKELPEITKDEVYILEPSVGVGSFIPFVCRKYESVKKVHLDVCDIDKNNLEILKILISKQSIPQNIEIRYIHDDFLLHKFTRKYDLIVGNPPFTKLGRNEAQEYLKENINKDTTNTFEFFLEKSLKISDYVALIMPKAILNTPEFTVTRNILSQMRIDCIQDYGENGFKGVLVETVCLFISPNNPPEKTLVESMTLNKKILVKQSYITDKKYPYWIIYRDKFFDNVANKLKFNVFDVFRDRQITNSNTYALPKETSIRVLKSRNISDDATKIINIDGYDSYIDVDVAKNLNAYKFVGNEDVYLTPNMTYKPRVMQNRRNVIVNGSVAVLIPKEKIKLTTAQMKYFSTNEYREFYQIARNYQTRSLNVDSTSVFFYGILNE
ncbi:DNA (cytosine-5-)-methyltransferase [Succinivibrio dextrinosolvens]|uniref:DNA (cytosine-5-)-methyltransferase n=1 Tax=Succinivibrio dextrinosolvens TaxID=83771 RepID=UPI001920F598|nr:DNA (cytosine-5-)-methyltransferase [Succinivibrio dextrinosolvens]